MGNHPHNARALRDRRLLTASGFVRATTTSGVGITLGVHLGRLGLHGRSLGLIISAGLVGAALAALAVTFLADRVGRRRCLLGLAALSVLGTIAFAWSRSPTVLAIAAFVGMLNGMGRDRGAALILEQAALPSTTTDQDRTRTIAVYTMLQDLGHALGAVFVGAPAWLSSSGVTSSSSRTPHPIVFMACAAASLLGLLLYASLSPAVDAIPALHGARLTPRSRAIVTRIAALFAVDGLAGGFLTTAMLSYFFFERFGATEGVIGALFFGARLMNAASHLGAAWLAKRIGLVNTMVFTHIPSSLLLMTVAVAPSFGVAAWLFLLREGLVEMDVPTRQSYVLAVVEPAERTLASGITNLVRLAAWAVAPVFAGALMNGDTMYLPLVIGSAMKIAYDILLWRAFRSIRPPEELAK
ncbi:MAG TPA: MFS transporter [Polyangiales bacterium]